MQREVAKRILEKLQKDYNAISQIFARKRERPWEEARFLVKNYLGQGEKILDLGCGVGQWFEFFKDKKVDYFGVDFAEKLIEIAKERYPQGKFVVASVFDLPFKNNFFDKVYAISLFHHIPSNDFRIKALKEAKRVLKENGILILSVWDLYAKKKAKKLILKFALLKIFGKSKLDFKDILMDFGGIKDCYFHCFTQRELRNLVKKASFDIIKEGRFFVGKNSNLYIVAKKAPVA
jgi:ubiquinone/menaquinone biosynthesis C-methylase UbiE